MQEGIVKFFNTEKGYGFITSKDSGKDIFVHNSGLIHEIMENDEVSYDTEEGKKDLTRST